MNLYETTEFDTILQLIQKVTNEQFQYGSHIHVTFYEVMFIVKGNVSFVVDNKKKELEYGDIIIVPPGLIHRPVIADKSDYERYVLHISDKAIRELSTHQTLLDKIFNQNTNYIIHLNDEDAKTYISYCNNILKYTNGAEFGADILYQSWVNILIMYIAQKLESTEEITYSMPPEKVLATAEYINKNFNKPLTIQGIADSQNLSRSYISHVFKDFYGMSIWNYVLYTRLLHARKLLMEDHTVAEACEESGFLDYHHFIKTFKKTFGVSPSKYKSSMEDLTLSNQLHTITLP